MRAYPAVVMVFAVVLGAGSAWAKVRVSIDLSHQRMHVVSSRGSYSWPISSARSGFSTPRGSYAATRLERMHYSRTYDNAPMPHAIFFRGGYAIHGTNALGALGRPASHGCVRLSPDNAAALYSMVQAEGAQISISGKAPVAQRRASRSPNLRYLASRSSGRRTYRGHDYEWGYDDEPDIYRPSYSYAPSYRSPPVSFADE